MKRLMYFGAAVAFLAVLLPLGCAGPSTAAVTMTTSGPTVTISPAVHTEKPSTVTAARPTDDDRPRTATRTVTPTRRTSEDEEGRGPTVIVTLPPTTVYRSPQNGNDDDHSGDDGRPYYPYYPPVVTVYPPIVTIYPPYIDYYPPVYPQQPALFGPFTVYLNGGLSFYYFPVLSSGHTVSFEFSVSGPAVYYWVLDPSNNIILLGDSGNSVYMSGYDSFMTSADGVYVLGFFSSQPGLGGIITLDYTIY